MIFSATSTARLTPRKKSSIQNWNLGKNNFKISEKLEYQLSHSLNTPVVTCPTITGTLNTIYLEDLFLKNDEWKNIINLSEVALEDGAIGDRYQFKAAPLASKMGAKKLGFHLDCLPPKNFSTPYHWHHSEEELFFVLEGKATLRQNGAYREVKKGDLIFFSNSPEGAHQFYNHTSEPFRYLALSTQDEMEVCEYPDSGKLMVAKLRKIFQHGKEVPYLTDEENPGIYWDAKHLNQ